MVWNKKATQPERVEKANWWRTRRLSGVMIKHGENAKHAVSTINESDSEEVNEDINLEEPPGQAMSHANKGNLVPHEALNAAAGGIFLYKTPNQAYQLLEDKFLLKLDWAKHQKLKTSLKKTVAFVDEGSSNSDTKKIMARMDAMTIKMDAQYKEIQSRAKCNHCGGNHSTTDCNNDDTPMSHEEEAKFI
ncbi:hypothetical protein Tco_1451396 [Tanacetum coccineum]